MEQLATTIVESTAPLQPRSRGKTMHINIASTYVSDWHPENGFREFFSNTVDGAYRLARQLSSRLQTPIKVCMRTVQDTNTVREIEFYVCRNASVAGGLAGGGSNSDDTLVVASIVGRLLPGDQCVLKLINFYTRLDHDVVLLMGGTTKTSQGGAKVTEIGKNGEGIKVGALAILRGDANMRGGSVVYYTAGNHWRFQTLKGRMKVMVRRFVNKSPSSRQCDAPADPSLHTTVVVRCQSSGADDVRVLDRMFPRDLYAPLLILSAGTPSALSAAPTLVFGAHQRGGDSDIVNCDAFILFQVDDDDDRGGSLFVNNMLVERSNPALPFVHYGDARLKGALGRDRDNVDLKHLGPQFAERVAQAIVRNGLDQRSASALFYILAERMRDIDRKEDAGAPKVITVWDYLVGKDVCLRWLADEFRRRHPDAYPCESDTDERVVRDRLGLTPCRVSRSLYRILTIRPLRTGFCKVECAAEELLKSAPTVIEIDPLETDEPFKTDQRSVAALVDKCLQLCGSDARVDRVELHATHVSAFLLDEHQVLHCPSTLFQPSLPRIGLLTKAIGCVVRMRQIASSMPDSFYETILPLVTSGNIVTEDTSGNIVTEDEKEEVEKEEGQAVLEQAAHNDDMPSLKRPRTIKGRREKKRLCRIADGGDDLGQKEPGRVVIDGGENVGQESDRIVANGGDSDGKEPSRVVAEEPGRVAVDGGGHVGQQPDRVVVGGGVVAGKEPDRVVAVGGENVGKEPDRVLDRGADGGGNADQNPGRGVVADGSGTVGQEPDRVRDGGGGDGSEPRAPLFSASAAASVTTVAQTTNRLPDRFERLPIAPERKHAASEDVCAASHGRALVRVSPPALCGATDDDGCAFYVEEEEDGGVSIDASRIEWPAMFWCARLARALLTRVFGYPKRTIAVVWAPTASYKAHSRAAGRHVAEHHAAKRQLVFNAALLADSDRNDVAFYQLFGAVCHELIHDSRSDHDAMFVAALENLIASRLAVHGREFAQKF